MAGLQRSAVSFRRQGSSGFVWDDRFLQEEINKQNQQQQQQQQDQQDITNKQQDQNQNQIIHHDAASAIPQLGSINTVQRSRSIGGGRGYRTGKVSPAIEPPSPRLSACGFCGAFGKAGEKTTNKLPKHRSSGVFQCRGWNIPSAKEAMYAQGFDPVIKLPRSGSTRTRTRSRRVLSVTDFGAKGDGFHNDTQAFLEVWGKACSLSGFINVDLPYGETFLVHPIDISGPCRSKITLRISGTIAAPQDPEAWRGLNQRKWLYFHGVNHLTIEGGGRIDGKGKEWWSRSCKHNYTNPCRPAPTALTFHRCKNLKIRNLMVLNSQKMHMAFTSCMRVVASNLEVLAPAFSPNTDGIHISATRGIEVSDCVIRTGDDCISIVRNTSRVWIRNITCGPGHGISIGSLGKSKAWEKIHNVNVNGAYLFHTDNGVRIKTWQGGSGVASKITFQNILMENVSRPIIIDQYYCDSRKPCENQTSAVEVGNISFIGIKGSSATEEAIKFACSDSSPCEGLYMEDIYLTSYCGGNTRSYCWQAHGSAQGFVYPPSCFPITITNNNDLIIRQNKNKNVLLDSNLAIQSV